MRVAPGEYPAITTAEADQLAQELGFARQTHGTGGPWLFYREGTQPGSVMDVDVRGGPDPEELRRSAAAARVADWYREQDGFDPLDEATLKAAESGIRKLRAKRDRLVVGTFFAFLVGAFATVAVGAAWINHELPGGFTGDDWMAYALAHAVVAGCLFLGPYWIKQGKRTRGEIRERHQPVITAYREAVLLREAELRNGNGNGNGEDAVEGER
ncbi:hypothetical protein [Streptomyces sp. MST-110588]|uniref:hypothetical protein n=1 Tax=Streptomyces sp. MST-110588 TaxID=2833628 RepID=UPI001F5DCCD1|nr:hypothetical protein [Streptomyces sp. MST-110588]UNO39213.1 hypothetical protein KGS77_05685 [Streptomyces sp. MST-110588]